MPGFPRLTPFDPCVALTAHGYELELVTVDADDGEACVSLCVTKVGEDRVVLSLRAASSAEAVQRAYKLIAAVRGWEALSLTDFHHP